MYFGGHFPNYYILYLTNHIVYVKIIDIIDYGGSRMKIQRFVNNPEVEFDINLIARMVHAINKAVTVNIPQQLQDQPLETTNMLPISMICLF